MGGCVSRKFGLFSHERHPHFRLRNNVPHVRCFLPTLTTKGPIRPTDTHIWPTVRPHAEASGAALSPTSVFTQFIHNKDMVAVAYATLCASPTVYEECNRGVSVQCRCRGVNPVSTSRDAFSPADTVRVSYPISKHTSRVAYFAYAFGGWTFLFFFMKIAMPIAAATKRKAPTTMPTMSAMLVSLPSMSLCLPTLSL